MLAISLSLTLSLSCSLVFLQVPGDMKRRVLRWYDYSWSRGRIQGGGDINTALGLLPDKLKTELALHVNLSVLKKVNRNQQLKIRKSLCDGLFELNFRIKIV